MVKLYSTGCPKCKVLTKKLEMKNLPFETIEDIEEINKFAEENDIHSAPFIVLEGGTILDFNEANKWISMN